MTQGTVQSPNGIFLPLFHIMFKGYEQSETPKMSQKFSRMYIEVCTQIDIWIVSHIQDIWLLLAQKFLLTQIKKTARFFDLGRNMVLAHVIPINFRQ